MVSGSISLFCSKYFSPFLHSTGSLSVSQEYLALPDGAGRFPQDFSGPAVLRIQLGIKTISFTGLSPSMIPLSRGFYYRFKVHVAVLQPRPCRNNVGLGCSHFAHHYSGNHYCFLFLQVLRCFSSLGLLSFRNTRPSAWWVAPFGDLRIKGCLHLPEAYRSLPRPSSPLRAKASTIHS
jgi:hypothetical protein